MLPSPVPLTRDLVLVGGGHAHALVLRRWGMAPLAGARVTVINPGPTAPYTGMLPGHLAGHYGRAELDIDLVRLCRFAGARLILGRAEGIDRHAKQIHVAGRPPVAYDVASLDVGITSDLPTIPGFADHGVPAKPLDRLADRWTAFVGEVAAGTARPSVAVIGAGVAGTELAMALHHRLKALEPSALGERAVRVTLIEADQPLRGLGRRTRRHLLARLAGLGIEVLAPALVERVDGQGVVLSGGERVEADVVIGAAGARPHDWLQKTGLPLTDGFVTVGPNLSSPQDPDLFAVGDCAHLAHAPRPKAGVFAVRQAPILYQNLRARLTGNRRFKPYHPQKDYLKLISLGDKAALADRGGLSLSGRSLWALKDRIDRDFMTKLTALPAMAAPKRPAERADGVDEVLGDGRPLCAGCGAKVADAPLRRALAGLGTQEDADVLQGAGDDAAVIRVGEATQILTTDHLRAFTDDPFSLARIAAVHALGDIWAMGAVPQVALVQVILPRMSEPLQDRTLQEIMAGAQEVLSAAGARIVGGHTSLGAELTIGFTVTGLTDAPVRVAGAQPGDAMLLTKAIGTGTVLAGEMATLARGADVAFALGAMARPQACAAEILRRFGAHAMTDVTGFGLAGHLSTMIRAEGLAARVDLAAVPFLPGAQALARAGVRSTLYEANRVLPLPVNVPDDPRAPLLFDPQTAGGLLAAVPADNAAACLDALHGGGDTAASRIGTIMEGPPRIDAV